MNIRKIVIALRIFHENIMILSMITEMSSRDSLIWIDFYSICEFKNKYIKIR